MQSFSPNGLLSHLARAMDQSPQTLINSHPRIAPFRTIFNHLCSVSLFILLIVFDTATYSISGDFSGLSEKMASLALPDSSLATVPYHIGNVSHFCLLYHDPYTERGWNESIYGRVGTSTSALFPRSSFPLSCIYVVISCIIAAYRKPFHLTKNLV